MGVDTERRRRPSASLVLAKLLLLALCALALTYAWANDVAKRYGATRETTIARVHANKLVVRLPADRAAPWNASTEEVMYVSYDDVPPVMREAILASEDSWFAVHPGFNPVALAKAVVSQFSADPRGGSTITQQLAKQLYTGSRRDYARKFDELAIAVWLEMNFSKRELLEFYVNTPFMGNGTKGIEAAARYYFDYSFKKVGWQEARLTPDMAASLAVTIKNPTHGNPTEPGNLREARRLLLSMGIEPDVLTASAVKGEGLPRRFAAPAFRGGGRLADQFAPMRDLAVSRLGNALGNDARDLDVTTFYSSEIQLYLERAAATYGGRLEGAGYDRLTAAVVDNRTGGVKAILAPPAARIYPGSAMKPFLALCPIVEWGWSGRTPVDDEPVGTPPVANHDKRYLGRIPLAEAMAKSRNPPFVTLLDRFGAACVDALLARMDTELRLKGDTKRAMALGAEPVDLMALLDAYVTLASCGRVSNGPLLVEEARDRRTQAVLYAETAEPMPADPELLDGFDRLHAILAEVTGPGGTADGSRFVREVAAKTGTADDNRQITLVTFTPAYTVLVSAGASDPRRIRTRLSSHALVPLVRNLNANIHPDGFKASLGCAVPRVVAEGGASRAGRAAR